MAGSIIAFRGREILRPFYFALGCVLLALGLVGIFVPLMPTTIFLILAAWCFARSSRRAEAWLLNHRRFGPAIVAWRTNGAIARRYKVLASLGIGVGLAVFLLVQPSLWVTALVGLGLAACAGFIWTRPD
jgi:uncharacterized protein